MPPGEPVHRHYQQREDAKSHGIAGFTSFIHPSNHDHLELMAEALATSRPNKRLNSPIASLSATGDTAESADGHLVAVIGDPHLSHKAGYAQALLAMYLEEGDDFLPGLTGDFSFVIVDPVNTRVLAAVDRFSRYPLYYGLFQETFVFSTTASGILSHPGVNKQVHDQSIFDYLYFHMVPSPNSTYENIRKLRTAHKVVFDNSEVVTERYWTPLFQTKQSSRFISLKNQLRHQLTKSVTRAASSEEPVGTFLSGGLDSSTVTGVLSELSHEPVNAFSIGFEEKGYDEMEYARAAADHFGATLHEYYVTPEDVLEALPLIAKSYDEPFGNSSALPAWFCAKLAAEHGIKTLLAGDGGDELFSGNERYARQKVFQRYHAFPPSVRHCLIDPLIKNLPTKFNLVKKAQSYIDQASVPLPDRLQSYNFLNRHISEEMFQPAFLREVQTQEPKKLMKEIYWACNGSTYQDRILYLDWQFTLADNDLRKVTHMCSIAGIDVKYPMLDDQLVELSCEVPASLKLKGQKLRYFYKESLRGWLPDVTIDKPKQGFGLPFGVWLKTYKPLQEFGYDLLESFKRRQILQPAFIEKLKDLHQNTHPHYYGEFIWVLIVLELWLQHHI